jgi:hypothetical protein
MASDRCKLCLEEHNLCDSHIIPEFLYQNLYDSNHRFIQVSKDGQINRFKGIYEKLLCSKCEKYLNKSFENYAKEILFEDKTLIKHEENNKIVITNVNYDKFKLFQLSLIWRMGISKRKEFINAKLGAKHEELLRKMIIEGRPGEPYEYPCIMAINTRKTEIDFNQLFISPEKLRFLDHIAYKLYIVGCMWIFIVSGHSKMINYQGHIWLDKRGLVIRKIDIDPHKAFAPILKMISKDS